MNVIRQALFLVGGRHSLGARRMSKPLAIDLYCGLGGWTEGLLAEGWDVVGFDIERHVYGEHRYPAQLVLQDVRTVHGSQFKNAVLIVASPPCQEFSYMAMPWSRAKQIARALRGEGDFPEGYKGSRTVEELTTLFRECFRIQREASEAAGRHIPMVVENVAGAQVWVGRSRWHYGSYHLWGDVPALMPMTLDRREVMKAAVTHRSDGVTNFHGRNGHPLRFDESGIKAGDRNKGRANGDHTWTTHWTHDADAPVDLDDSRKLGGGASWHHPSDPRHTPGLDFTRMAGAKTQGHVNRRDGHSHTRHLTNQAESDAVKNGGDWFSSGEGMSQQRRANSKSTARKAASARIAKIPFALAAHIAHTYYPGAPSERESETEKRRDE